MGRKNVKKTNVISSDDDDDSFVATKTSNAKTSKVKSTNIKNQKESEEDSPVVGRGKKSKNKYLEDSEESSDEEIEVKKSSKTKDATLDISESDEEGSEDAFEETPIRKSGAKKNNRMLDDHSVHEIENSTDNSSGEEEEDSDGEDDDDEEYDVSDSSGEDFESPAVVKTKTPKHKTVATKLKEESSDEELVDVFPSPVDTFKFDKKSSENFKFEKKSFENIEQVLSGPFNIGQKFTKAEVGALETKLTSIRRSIEKVTTNVQLDCLLLIVNNNKNQTFILFKNPLATKYI